MIIGYVIAGVVVLFDIITKIIAFNVEPVGATFIPNFVEFNLTFNSGAAFSFMANNTPLLAILSLVVSGLLGYAVFKFSNFKARKLLTIALGLILGGTFGNMIDRFLTVFGAVDGVIDFVDVYLFGWHFPGTFNFADMCLVTGVVILAVDMLIVQEVKNKGKERLNEDEIVFDNENDDQGLKDTLEKDNEDLTVNDSKEEQPDEETKGDK